MLEVLARSIAIADSAFIYRLEDCSQAAILEAVLPGIGSWIKTFAKKKKG